MTELKLVLIIIVVIVSAAVIGAFVGQLYPRSGVLYLIPVGIGVGLSIRLIARHLARKREI